MGCGKMRRDKKQKEIALAVGIALSAGMFSIVPVAYGAPVHDANSGITNALPATAIDQTGTADAGGVLTKVTGTQTNNVVAWKDFSVGKTDEVQFANNYNYMNVVTGAATSQIDGKITGGNNVYIVNPNGVIFGKDASVNVGSLYVSTEDVASAVSKAADMGTAPASVLQAGTPNADVVNLGSIQASAVQVEGKNIRFLDSAKVTTNGSTANSNVTLNAASGGYVHVGNATGVTAGYNNGSTSIDYYELINSASELAGITNMSGNYMLSQDIVMPSTSFTPIGSSSAPFKGKFDGMFYEVQNLYESNALTRAGLFGVIKGTSAKSARVDNLGITIKSVESTDKNSYVGGLAGEVSNAVIRNVYSEAATGEAGTVTGKKRVGGLIGSAGTSSTVSSYTTAIENVYNTSKPVLKTGSGNGVIGFSEYGVEIENAYNTNSNVNYGITNLAYNQGNYQPKASYIYTTTSSLVNDTTNVTGGVANAGTQLSTYVTAGWTDGSVINNDGQTSTPWRIYEGVSTPILTAFLKGTATADYNYNYFASSTDTTATSNGLTLAGGLSGANNGADISAIYNAQYLKVADSTGTTAGTAGDITLTSNATSSDITLNTAGIRNVSGDNLPQALIASGQHGYNIVGGNVTVNKRTVKAQSGTFSITKEYDGSADGTAAFGQALTGGGNVSFGGLLAGDDVQLSGVTATYKNSSNQDDGNVGYGKTVAVTVGSSPGLAGSSAGNYTLDASSLSNLTVTGDITPRTLYVKLKNTSGLDKTYDGTTTVTAANAAASTNVEIDTSKGISHQFVTGESGALDTSATVIAYNDKHAGSKTIDYTNIALTGNNAQNYMLVVENSQSATGYDLLYDGYANRSNTAANRVYGTGTLQATGTINQRVIDPTSFQVKDTSGNIANASKPYDGTSAFNSTGYTLVSNATSSGNTGVVSGDSINFSIVNGQANFQDASGNNTSSATTSGLTTAATKVGYSITAAAGNSTTLLSDYTLNGSTLSNTGTYTVSGTGTISKRTINVAVTNTNAIDKEYDGMTAVKDTNAAVFGTGGYVDYVSGATANDKLTGNDGATITVSAAYDSKAAGARTIDYTVTINGTAAANYDLDGTGTITDKLLGTTTGANGTISPKNLSSSFTAVTKTYDGTTNVPTAGTGSLTGIISGDTVSLQSGYTAQFHSKNVGQTWVDYSGLSLTGTDAGNYTISSTAQGAGSITALTLKKGDFTYTFAPISKEYDGTTALNNAASYITGVTVTSTGDVIKDITTGVDYTSNVSGVFTSKDSNNSTSQTVNYTVTILGDGSGNYTIPAAGIQDTTTSLGTITPKTVIASIASTALANTTKTYDATTSLVDGQGNTLSGNDVITFTDVNGGTGLASVDSNASTAVYKDQGGDAAKDAYAGQTKNILYTAAITTTDSSNYNIVDSSQQALPNNQLTGTGTINKRALTVTFGDTTKTYDGTDVVASDAAHILPTLGNKAPDGVALDVTKITGQYTGRTDNTAVGSNLDVSYSNLQQALGSFTDNYTISNTGSGKGAITTLTLTNSNFKFDFNTITKEYDGSKSVAYTDRNGNAVTAESFIGDHYVDMDGSGTYNTGDVLLQGITATFAEYQSADSNSSASPQAVTYTLTLGNNLSNFNTSGLTNITTASGAVLNYSNGVLTANTTGTITPRTVYVSLSNTPVIKKPYDGGTSVTQNVQNIIAQNGLLGTDGTMLDTSVINARYDNADAGARNVYYDVALTGGNTSNYKLAGATGATYAATTDLTGTLTGTGTIEKAPLTISFGYTEKDYDGTAAVLANTIAPTLSGFVGTESDAPAEAYIAANVTGNYGTWDSTNGLTADEHVNRLTDNSVGYKGVVYQGINAALNSYVQSNSTAAARNYYIDLDATAAADATGNTLGGTVADTLYFKEAAAKGKIKPLALVAGDIQAKWTGPITKEYDGTAEVKKANGTINDYMKLEATKTVNGTQLTLNIPYTVLASNATYNGGKDVSTSGQGVTYKLSGLTTQALGDFDITQTLADSYDIAKSGANAIQNSANATTSITPKLINTGLTKSTDIDKVYDSNSVADKSNAYWNVSDIVAADQSTVSVAVTNAYYADKTTGNQVTAASAMPGQGNDAYDVKYVYTLTDALGNYTLAGSTVQTGLTLTGTGDILKRKVLVDFAAGMGTGIDKAYDGSNSVAAAYKNPNRFTLSSQNGDTGILTAEQNIVELANSINAAYQSPNVQRKANGQVTTQAVTFSNFNLQGTSSGNGSGNYYLTTADGTGELKGEGTISPLTVDVSIKDAPTKEYDGTVSLSAPYNTAANLIVDKTNLVGTDTINVGVVSASYVDKNAENGTKAYTYQLDWDNGNYDLVAKTTAAGETMTVTGYANGKAQGTLGGTNGTITPRLLTVQSVADADKEYDGTDAVKNAAYNVNLDNRVISGDNIGLVASGQYDSANASADENTAAPVVQNVNYTLNLTNGNYQLAQNTAQGKGTIRRKGLAIVADPVSINAGEAMPVFTGKVTGFVNGERDNYTAFINGLIYKTKDGVSNTTPGSYGVYGWYMGKNNGLVGRNYTFDQSASNDSALTINYVNTNMGNPDTKITPSNNVYNQISKDMNSGFGDNGVAAIEYQDKRGKVLARENIDSGEIHGSGLVMGNDAGDMSNQNNGVSHIGIVGGEIVNMEGVDAASSANIEVSANGTTVNLEVVDITNADNRQSIAGIEIMDKKEDILGEEAKDKTKEKESEIAIKSSSGDHEDEIELKVESDGVNVA